MQLQQEKQIAKLNLLRKCGLLAHTSAAFLKNCCTEKLFSLPAALIPATKNPDRTIIRLFCRDLLYDSIVSGIWMSGIFLLRKFFHCLHSNNDHSANQEK